MMLQAHVETYSGTKAGSSDCAVTVPAAASAVLPVIDVAALQDVKAYDPEEEAKHPQVP